jgi:hypothetical protein
MREIRLSGSMSGMWKRSRVNLVRHRQTKEPGTDRGHLNHRATSRLYRLNLRGDIRVEQEASHGNSHNRH